MSSHNFYVLSHHHDNDGIHTKILGKFHMNQGDFRILEDHGMHPDLEDAEPARRASILSRLATSSRTGIVNEDSMKEFYPGVLDRPVQPPSEELKSAIAGKERNSTFLYHREGMPNPQVLKIKGTKGWLDDAPLSDPELQQVLSNVHQQKAKITHPPKITKSEPHTLPSTDSLCPNVGNLHAYKQAVTESGQTHIHIDGNDFVHLAETLGHQTETEATVALFRAIKDVADEVFGSSKAKCFRFHSDECRILTKDAKSVPLFCRSLRARLDAIPPVKGAHQLSVCIGFGSTPPDAQQSLLDAKKQKDSSGNAPGLRSTFVGPSKL